MREVPATGWARDVSHPLPLGAVAVLALNDHWLKQAGLVPALVTGKLSDLAGLFVLPLLVMALVRGATALARRPAAADRAVPVVVVAIAAAFTAAKLWPAGNAWLGRWWGSIVMDPTDLACLPALVASWWWLRRRTALAALAHAGCGTRGMNVHSARSGNQNEIAAVAITAWACVATPAPRYARNYPAWELDVETGRMVGCAKVSAWVAKSGKQGLGVTVRLDGLTPERCEVRVAEAGFTLVGGAVVRPDALPATTLRGREAPEYLYLAFAFDNEAAWNRGQRQGMLALRLTAGSADSAEWTFRMTHRLRGFQRNLRPAP